eukprot:scaffold5887_cov69-Phaeocystis_antarctica.AAC.1
MYSSSPSTELSTELSIGRTCGWLHLVVMLRHGYGGSSAGILPPEAAHRRSAPPRPILLPRLLVAPLLG